MTKVLLTFVQISDTHITVGDKTEFRPHHYSERLTAYMANLAKKGINVGHIHDIPASVANRALVQEINALPFPIDFVLHTGDTMTDPDTVEEYEAVTEIFRDLNVPIYYMAGNHDNVPALRSLMPTVTTTGDTFDYVISQNGARVICMDSASNGVDHAGGLSDAQIEWLRDLLAVDKAMPTVIAIHHPPISLGNDMLDFFGFAKAETLRDTIRQSGANVSVVLSGHIHQAVDTIQDGLLYTCVQSPFGQMPIFPALSPSTHPYRGNPGFNIVIVTEEQTYIRRYAYTNPVVEAAKN